MTETTSIDPVIRTIVRDEALKALDRVSDREVLETVWAIAHGTRRPHPLAAGAAQAREQIRDALTDEGVPHRLVYECWDTLREVLEPTPAVHADLSAVAGRLDALFGMPRRVAITS